MVFSMNNKIISGKNGYRVYGVLLAVILLLFFTAACVSTDNPDEGAADDNNYIPSDSADEDDNSPVDESSDEYDCNYYCRQDGYQKAIDDDCIIITDCNEPYIPVPADNCEGLELCCCG